MTALNVPLHTAMQASNSRPGPFFHIHCHSSRGKRSLLKLKDRMPSTTQTTGCRGRGCQIPCKQASSKRKQQNQHTMAYSVHQKALESFEFTVLCPCSPHMLMHQRH